MLLSPGWLPAGKPGMSMARPVAAAINASIKFKNAILAWLE